MSFNYYTTRKDFNRAGRWADPLETISLKRWRRNQTWDVASDTEAHAQRHPVGNDDDRERDAPCGVPIKHSKTAPGRVHGDRPQSDKETDVQHTEPYSQPNSGEASGDSQLTAVGIGGPSDLAAAQGAVGPRRRNLGNRDSHLSPDDDGSDRADEQPSQEKRKKPNKSSSFIKHLIPKEPFTVANQLRRTLLYSWINILILAVPVGIALNFVTGFNKIIVFIVNFLAIIPLAALLSFGTEEVALRLGETVGGLLNASLGNAVELIVAIIALTKGEIAIVQTSLIGSILSNLLLVMGMCFFFGGINRQEQFFNTTVAQTAASLLALAVAGVIVPTVFDMTRNTPPASTAALSRGTSVILLVVYGAYLFFQLHTHSKVLGEQSQKVQAKPFKRPSMMTKVRGSLKQGAIAQGLVSPAGVMGGHCLPSQDQEDVEKLRDVITTPPKKRDDKGQDEEEDDEEEPQLHFLVAIALLVVSTVIIALCAEFMVDSIDAVTEHVSEEFVGLILLPIVGNAAEHATAVTVAVKDKMDLAIGVAVGSSMQVALFIIPLLVIVGWGLGVEDMSLSFDTFQVAVLFVAVLLVNYLIADGKSHWLEGFLLICLYAIIAVCSFWYPTEPKGTLDQ